MRHRGWLAAFAALAVLPLVPGLDSDFVRSVLTQMAIAAVFALSYNVLFGQTGLLSFGHAVYYGLGGYAAIHLMRAINHGLALPMPLVPFAGALAGIAFGALFGALTTRRAGTIFALITLGIGELVYSAAFIVPSLFGGEEGITASRTLGPALFGIGLASQIAVYYVVAAWAFVAALSMRAFTTTPVGRMCNAVRDNPQRAAFVGYDPRVVRLIACCVAGLFAGLAGGLHAINYEIVSADSVGALRSGSVLLMTCIGGAGQFAGPVLGAVVLTWLEASLSGYTSAWLLYLGIFLMIVVVFAPRGLAGLIAMHAPLARTPAFGRVLLAYAVAAAPAAVTVVGLVTVIEMSYRVSTQPELGTKMRIAGVAVDAASPVSWIAGVIVAAAGFAAFRRTRRIVASAWTLAEQQRPAARATPS
ncbi:MAG TPA: branched-chain amino acid ABC transporter permease [Casimicrobiaceae bacterium]|nr:branched-chain amino acid ABC transporter permease [Casimicrobiaceae bacterium]